MKLLLAVLLPAALSAQTIRIPANERVRVPALDHPLVLALRATGKLDGGVSDKTRRVETPVSTTEDAPYEVQLVETWKSPRPEIARSHYEARLVRLADGATLTKWHLSEGAKADELESVAFLISQHFEWKAQTFTSSTSNRIWENRNRRRRSGTGWSFGPTG